MRIRQLLLALLLFSPLAVLGEDCPEDLFAAVDRLSLSGHPITAGSLSEPTGICSGLSIRYYGNLEARRIRDLDLLAPPGQIPQVAQLLLSLGFSCKSIALYPDFLSKHFVHAKEYRAGNLSIDLHSSFRVRPAYRIDTQKIRRDSQQDTINGSLIRTPSDQHNLLLLVLSIAGDLELGKLRAKSLVDLQALATTIETQNSWDDFFDQRADENTDRIAVNVLSLLLQVMPESATSPMLKAALTKRQASLVTCSREAYLNLLTAQPYSFSNRQWFLSIYPGNRWLYYAWLAVGIPVKDGFLGAIQKALRSLGKGQ